MDGFKVDTIALSRAGISYKKVGNNLSDAALELRAIQISLSQSQTISPEISELLREVISNLEQCVSDANDLGRKCEEVSDIYEGTERRVMAMVNELFAKALFTQSAAPARSSRLFGNPFDGAATPRIMSDFIPIAPIMFTGNRLPGENWLLERALKEMIDFN
jgi:hypothetical protein